MRFAERFLVLLALIAIIVRLTGSNDGATLELIALPLLAMFYLFGSWFLIHDRSNQSVARPFSWQDVTVRIVCGVGFAYCIFSLMLFTLGQLPRLDMLENCGLILFLLTVFLLLRYRKRKDSSMRQFLFRVGILAGIILAVALFTWLYPVKWMAIFESQAGGRSV